MSEHRPATSGRCFSAAFRPSCCDEPVENRSARRDMTLGVGDPLPDLELVDHEGRRWRTAELRGRPLVLVLHRHLA
jgi:hypothetical protein